MVDAPQGLGAQLIVSSLQKRNAQRASSPGPGYPRQGRCKRTTSRFDDRVDGPIWQARSPLVHPVVSVTFYGIDATRVVDHGRFGRHPAVVEIDSDEPAFLNVTNANARALLDLLGFEPGGDFSGSVPMAEARRAVIRARVLDRTPERYTRPIEVVPSRARRREDGAVELTRCPGSSSSRSTRRGSGTGSTGLRAASPRAGTEGSHPRHVGVA